MESKNEIDATQEANYFNGNKIHKMIRNNTDEICKLKRDIDNITNLNSELKRTYLFLDSLLQEQKNRYQNMKQEDISNSFIESLISRHNEILAEQISFLEKTPKNQSKFSEQFDEHNTTYQENKIKSKIRFFQRECNQIQEFVKQEIEFELEEDNNKIKELNNVIFTLSNELRQTKLKLAQLKAQKFEFELSNAFNKMLDAKQLLDDKYIKLSNLKAENEQIQTTIDLQIENSKRLEKEKNELYNLKKLLEDISY